MLELNSFTAKSKYAAVMTQQDKHALAERPTNHLLLMCIPAAFSSSNEFIGTQ